MFATGFNIQCIPTPYLWVGKPSAYSPELPILDDPDADVILDETGNPILPN